MSDKFDWLWFGHLHHFLMLLCNRISGDFPEGPLVCSKIRDSNHHSAKTIKPMILMPFVTLLACSLSAAYNTGKKSLKIKDTNRPMGGNWDLAQGKWNLSLYTLENIHDFQELEFVYLCKVWITIKTCLCVTFIATILVLILSEKRKWM